MLIRLDRERFETPLIQMTAANILIVRMPSLRVGQRRPMHEIGQLAIPAGPQHQVPVVWHQTIGQQARSMHMFLRFGDNVQERFVVKVLVKNWQPSIAPVEDMIEIAAQRVSPRPAHAVDNNQPAESSQEKKGPDTFSRFANGSHENS